MYIEVPLRAAVLRRSASSLCVSIKPGLLGCGALVHQALACGAGKMKHRVRRAPKEGLKDASQEKMHKNGNITKKRRKSLDRRATLLRE